MAWTDCFSLSLQVASVSATSVGDEAGYWQPDAHGTVWQPDTGIDSSQDSYGEWAQDLAPVGNDWSTLPWWSIHCDLLSLETNTGFGPYSWNAEAGTLSAVLRDAEVLYTPLGPPGSLDDIGIDTPIRVRAQYRKPANMAGMNAYLWSGLIRTITFSTSPNGAKVTTINASEVIEVYGRTNPIALTSLVPEQALTNRLDSIHARADRPDLFKKPVAGSFNDGVVHAADDLHDNVWQEMTHAINAHGFVAATSLDAFGTPGVVTLVPQPPAAGTAEQPAASQARQVRPTCSPATGLSPTPNGTTLAISPQDLVLSNTIDGVANDISIALAGSEGSAVEVLDQASIDRWGRHTYTRHDLKLTTSTVPAFPTTVANRILNRSKQAVYVADNLTFPLVNERDAVWLVGFPGYYTIGLSQLQPGSVAYLVWDDPDITARLWVCGVNHSINPDSWTTSLSLELQNVNNTGPIVAPLLKETADA